MTQTNDIPISVLVRTFNSARTLDRLLSSLKLFSGDEVIVVDSGSTDNTLSVAAVRGAQIVRATGPFNYSKSLNLGFRAARHPWVLVISSHSVSKVPDLLGAFRSVVRDLPADVVVAYGINTLDGRGPYNDEQARFYTEQNYHPILSHCGNGNTLYRRSAWEELPFDENIRTGEDKLWLEAAFQRCWRICLASGARSINRSQYSLRYMFLKGYSDSRAFSSGPMTILSFGLGLGSLLKRFLRGGMPVGNLVRYGSHNVGRFFGSRQKRDNAPEVQK